MPAAVIDALASLVEAFFNKATRVVNHLGLQDVLTSTGFTHLKSRFGGRARPNKQIQAPIYICFYLYKCSFIVHSHAHARSTISTRKSSIMPYFVVEKVR